MATPPSSQQFMFVELASMQDEIKTLSLTNGKAARSCLDVQLEHPESTSGPYTIDPNLGSSADALKAYCDFGESVAKTCVDNTTASVQLSYLHLLHTKVYQSIQLPCSSKGPLK